MGKYSGFLTVFVGGAIVISSLIVGVVYATKEPAIATVIVIGLLILYRFLKPLVSNEHHSVPTSRVVKQKSDDEFDSWMGNYDK